MSIITMPRFYENNVKLEESGELLLRLGKKAFVLSGFKAYEAAGSKLMQALDSVGITYKVEKVDCYPTLERAKFYAEEIKQNGSDFVISLGGGRITDLAKVAAELANLQIATIPTIPSTCTPWTTLSVLYNEDGEMSSNFHREEAPALVIVDKELLLSAPKKYFVSGITDSMAKWYEVSANYHGKNTSNFQLALQAKTTELLVKFIEDDFLDDYINNPESVSWETKSNVLDAIFFITGVPGSIKGGVSFGGLAHPFYNFATRIKDTHVRLHGEIVIFGLFMQHYIEGWNKDKIKDKMIKVHKLGAPITIKELGISENTEQKISKLAQEIADSVKSFVPIEGSLSAAVIENAIYAIDSLGKEIEDEVA